MRITADISGIDTLTRQLADLAGDADAVMSEVIGHVVTKTRNAAVSGIQSGPATGRTYRRGGVVHRAAAPGQYPMSDTGRLANSVQAVFPTPSSLSGMVGTNLVYGRYLEFGTSKMAARPWLMPSFEAAKVDVERRLKRAIEART